ncbi:unnamed protein product, partial [Laminaria digitata]
RIFFVSSGSTLTLDNLILTGGNSSGTGGAIAIEIGSSCFVADCNFVGNRASLSG